MSIDPLTPLHMSEVVVGLDPTAGLWSAEMTRGPKEMASVALKIGPGDTIAAYSPLLAWHTSNEDFWSRVAELGASLTCIDGPCDTNGLLVLPNWSGWDLQRRGKSRDGESALASEGVGLFWTTFATIVGFDGAARWIARSLRLFREIDARGTKHGAIETHPHGAFRFLRSIVGRSPDMDRKDTSHGRTQRLEVLSMFIAGLRPSDVPNHDALDAACAALVAALHRFGRATSFGTAANGGKIWMPDLTAKAAFRKDLNQT